MQPSHIRSAASGLGVALIMAACSDAGSGPAGDAQVSLSLATRSAAAANAAVVAGPETYTDRAGNTLVIDRVELVLRELELENETGQGTCGTDASSDDGDCAEIELGPFLVDLPLGVGGAARTVTASVPAGTYDEIKFQIREPDNDTAADDAFIADHPDFVHTSIKVEGSFNGAPFTFLSDLRAELKLELSPPLVVDASGTADLTLFADLGAWFRDAGGNLVDPGSSASATLVGNNIARSFNAFEDENHDGSDDHGGTDDGAGDDNGSGGQGADDGAAGI
jgi:hypothetical protein